MKICPRCQKSFSDDNLNFCLEDGTTLQPMAAGAAPPPPTIQMNQPPVTSPTPAIPSQQPWSQPAQQFGGAPPKKSSKAWIWVLLILGFLVVVCGGGFGLLAYIGYKSEQANSTSTSNTSVANKKPSNSFSTNSSTSSSSRSDLTTVGLNVFEHNFSIYGTTTLDGDELTVKPNSGIAYYVLAAPEDYTTDDADTRVTVKAVAGSSSRGYGLIFHSNPTPLQQGYAFLIDAKRKKYSIVHHEPQKELSVVKWTSSPAINADSAENTLEVRDHDGAIDLYINDTKVNSISNTYGFSGGVAGLYVGNGATVAFKDLEIRR